ncbi:MAG: hypothetical protein EBZ47_09355 [Chlamydiae bacterium]|nr:hypothetical protein [Chlamydiota bacterium]
MFKKSLLVGALIGSFCAVQSRNMQDKIYAAYQKGAVVAVDQFVAQVEMEFPGNDIESLKKRKEALETIKEAYVLGQSNLALSKDANMAVVTFSAGSVALAASYIKRSRALRIGCFMAPFLGAFAVFTCKATYYGFEALIEEFDGRIRQIEWRMKIDSF